MSSVSMRAFATTSLVGLALSTASCPGQGSTRLETAHPQVEPVLAAVDAHVATRFTAAVQAAIPEDEVLVLEADALVEGVRTHGLAMLSWPDAARTLQARAAFAARHGAAVADLSDAALLEALDDWLPALVAGKRRLGEISADALHAVLDARLGWDGRRTLDRIAPATFASPAGSSHAIDYEAEGGPAVEVRVQALFGLARHPAVAEGRAPLLLRLTSPAGRPIQTTRDLPGFWTGSWAAVAKEMRGRYPKHPWPDDPTRADPTLRTKKAAARS